MRFVLWQPLQPLCGLLLLDHARPNRTKQVTQGRVACTLVQLGCFKTRPAVQDIFEIHPQFLSVHCNGTELSGSHDPATKATAAALCMVG
jgi:hypothetical protein